MGDSRPPALLAESDLFFAAPILRCLEAAGFVVATAATAEDAAERARALAPTLAVVSLNSQPVGGLETVRRLKEAGVRRVMAYVSHVRIPALREAAIAAGVDRLCSNSAVSVRLPELLERLLAPGPGRLVEDEQRRD